MPSRTTSQKQVAFICFRAKLHASSDADEGGQHPRLKAIPSGTLKRIKDCLILAQDLREEAHMRDKAHLAASRCMAAYNIEQADLIEQACKSGDVTHVAGESKVRLTRNDNTGKEMDEKIWIRKLAVAMRTTFNCRYYSRLRFDHLEYTFYGIAGNTIAAVEDFESAYMTALTWSRKATASESYLLGLADELFCTALRSRKEEVRLAKEREEREEREEQERQERKEQEHKAQEQHESRHRQNLFTHSKPSGSESNTLETKNKAGDELRIEPEQQEMASLESSPKYDAITEVNQMNTNIQRSRYDLESDISSEDFKDNSLRDYLVAYDSEDDNDENDDKDGIEQRGLDTVIKIGLEMNGKVAVEPTFMAEDEGDPLGNLEAFTRVDTHKVSSEETSEKFGRKASPVNEINLESQLSLWKSASHVEDFRQSAERVADEYLKQMGKKLRDPKRLKRTVRSIEAYKQGREDGKSMDVKRRRIEGPKDGQI